LPISSDATPRPSLPPFHTDGRCLKAPSGFRDFSSFRPRRGRAQPLAGVTRRVLLTFPFPMPRLRWRAPTYDTRLTTRSFFYQQLHLDKAESKQRPPRALKRQPGVRSALVGSLGSSILTPCLSQYSTIRRARRTLCRSISSTVSASLIVYPSPVRLRASIPQETNRINAVVPKSRTSRQCRAL